ncbi:hypothetical protein EVAR_79698_1 [Eumeta japonica]|uniref:Uncharacterized protein n=1 Tax=Eumeta variegata TaxID=151549 RepID=A0A4C1TBQ5_EUMVA|nr:hypothetical protein EVAR_79698_1 [Eumeta japonica]
MARGPTARRRNGREDISVSLFEKEMKFCGLTGRCGHVHVATVSSGMPKESRSLPNYRCEAVTVLRESSADGG